MRLSIRYRKVRALMRAWRCRSCKRCEKVTPCWMSVHKVAQLTSAALIQHSSGRQRPVHRAEAALAPEPAHTHMVAVRAVPRESRCLRRAQLAQLSSRLRRRGNAQQAAHAFLTTCRKHDCLHRRASPPKVASQVHVALRQRSMRPQARAQASQCHGARIPSETLSHKCAITCPRPRDVHRMRNDRGCSAAADESTARSRLPAARRCADLIDVSCALHPLEKCL